MKHTKKKQKKILKHINKQSRKIIIGYCSSILLVFWTILFLFLSNINKHQPIIKLPDESFISLL